MREWLRVSEVASLMGMSRRGALKRLQVKNRQYNGRLLRRERNGSPWEVSMSVLQEERLLTVAKPQEDQHREVISEMRERLESMDVRLVGTRNSLNAWRRKFDRRLEKHERAIKKLGEGADAVRDLLETT